MTEAGQLEWLSRTPYSAAVYMHAHGWNMLGATSGESLWAVPDGVSANLLEALVRLGGGPGADQESAREFDSPGTTSSSAAPTRPGRCSPPPATFSRPVPS